MLNNLILFGLLRLGFCLIHSPKLNWFRTLFKDHFYAFLINKVLTFTIGSTDIVQNQDIVRTMFTIFDRMCQVQADQH